MFNYVTLQGRVVRDPEIRRTGTGKAVVSVPLAVERDYRSDSGEKIVDFFDCVIWAEPGERFAKYNGKGDEVIVGGQLQQRKWTDKDGNNRSTVEVRVDRWNFGRRVGNREQEESSMYGPPAAVNPYVAEYAALLNQSMPNGMPPAVNFVPIDEDGAQLPF